MTEKTLLFFSEHCILDQVSGAAISGIELLQLLRRRGWTVSALCGPLVDKPQNLRDADIIKSCNGKFGRIDIYHYLYDGISIKVATAGQTSQTECRSRLALPVLLKYLLVHQRQDIVLTYGGGWIATLASNLCNSENIPITHWLRNFQYLSAHRFSNSSAVIVPSAFAAQYYKHRIGINAKILTPSIEEPPNQSLPSKQKFLTLVNPIPEKGIFFSGRILLELARLLPDLPILIVLGRGGKNWLDRIGINNLTVPRLRLIDKPCKPQEYLALSRIVLMPSLWDESFGRVAAEAMRAGIPTVVSDRGALPETAGTGAIVLPVPKKFTSEYSLLATAEEVSAWIYEILRLINDAEYWDLISENCRRAGERFSERHVGEQAEKIFCNAIESFRFQNKKNFPGDPTLQNPRLEYPGNFDSDYASWESLTERQIAYLLASNS